jgi:hypothetical protein
LGGGGKTPGWFLGGGGVALGGPCPWIAIPACAIGSGVELGKGDMIGAGLCSLAAD